MKVSDKSRNAIIAQLYDAGGDPSGRWFVYYSIPDPITGKKKRIKVYEGFAQCKTAEDKRKNARKLITRINRQLEGGKDPSSKKIIEFSAKSSKSVLSKDDISEVLENNKPVVKLTIEHCLNEVIKDNKGHWRKKTADTYQSQLNIFFNWLKLEKLEGIDISSFTKAHASSFLSYLSNSKESHNTTRNNYATNFKSFFKKLKKKGLIENSAFEDEESVRSSKTSKKPYNKQQREIIKHEIYHRDKELWLFIQIMYYCFIRPKELTFLQIRDIDLYEGRIRIRGEEAKNGLTMAVRIPKQLLGVLKERVLESYPQNYFLFGNKGKPGDKRRGLNYFSRKHREIIRELGFTKEYALYSWKHTGVISAVKGGIHPVELKAQIRHQSLDEVQEYLKDLGAMDSEALRDKFPDF